MRDIPAILRRLRAFLREDDAALRGLDEVERLGVHTEHEARLVVVALLRVEEGTNPFGRVWEGEGDEGDDGP